MKLGNGRAELAAEVLGACGLVVVAAQLLLESDGLEHGHAILKRELLIGVPEEAGVVEAGAQHALIAVAHNGFALGIGNRVEHSKKVRRELSVGILNREVLLVVAHHGDQNFFGQREKFAIEVAEDDRRSFGEIDDGIEQSLIFSPARAGDLTHCGVEGFADLVLALGVAGQHIGGAQLVGIFGGRGEWDRSRGKDAMPAGGAAGGDAAELERHNIVIKKRDEPAHGAHEALRLARTPVHVFGPVEGGDFLGNELGEQRKRRASLCRSTLAARYSPFAVVAVVSSPSGTPTFLAKATAAWVGWPSL